MHGVVEAFYPFGRPFLSPGLVLVLSNYILYLSAVAVVVRSAAQAGTPTVVVVGFQLLRTGIFPQASKRHCQLNEKEGEETRKTTTYRAFESRRPLDCCSFERARCKLLIISE